MKFEPLDLDGVWLIHSEAAFDSRGWFARTFCREEFSSHGLELDVQQANLSWNRARGTLRGLHYQVEPWAEAKLISVLTGEIFDVAVDLRHGSPTYGRSCYLTLSEGDQRRLYIPRGFAHGFQTLTDNVLIHYTMFGVYHPEAARGIVWNDPELGIPWPLRPTVVSERDRDWPRLEQAET